MERFRLRARHEPRRGLIWEVKLFPDHPRRVFLEADGRALGEIATPVSIHWLRRIAEPFLERADDPIAAEKFGPQDEPRWLRNEDGMRLALAFSAARWLRNPSQRKRFREGLRELPSEVVLYWFTLCFYGYRQAAGRAALRTLLTYEGPEDAAAPPHRRRRRHEYTGPTLFGDVFDERAPGTDQVQESDAPPTAADEASEGEPGQSGDDAEPEQAAAKSPRASSTKGKKPRKYKTARQTKRKREKA